MGALYLFCCMCTVDKCVYPTIQMGDKAGTIKMTTRLSVVKYNYPGHGMVVLYNYVDNRRHFWADHLKMTKKIQWAGAPTALSICIPDINGAKKTKQNKPRAEHVNSGDINPLGGPTKMGSGGPVSSSVRTTDEVAIPSTYADTFKPVLSQTPATKEVQIPRVKNVEILSALNRQNWAPIPVKSAENLTFTRAGKSAVESGKFRSPVRDLRAWQRLWELADWEVAQLLRLSLQTTMRYLYGSPSGMMGPIHSGRFRRLCVRSRINVLRKMKQRNTYKARVFSSVMPTLVRVRYAKLKSKRYLRESLCHGLWPNDLLYYRYPVGSGQYRRSACIVVHKLARMSAKSEDYIDFVQNRSIAEARLAVAIGKAMGEVICRGRRTLEDRRRKIK